MLHPVSVGAREAVDPQGQPPAACLQREVLGDLRHGSQDGQGSHEFAGELIARIEVLVGDDLAHALLGRRAHAEVRVEGAQRAVEGENRAGEDGERGRRPDSVAVEDADDLGNRRGVEASALQRGEHHAEVELQRCDVDAFARLAGDSAHGTRKHRGIAQGEAERHLLQALERHGIDPPDSAEVNEPQRAVLVHEHVPRMRIRVVNAIGEDLG